MTYDLFTFQSQSNSKTKADKGNPTSSLVARSSNLDILNDSVTQSQCQCWGLCINSLGRVVAVAGSPSPESRLLCLGLGPGPSNWQESMNQVLDCKFQWCWLHYACLSLSLSPARLQSMGPSCVVVSVNLGTDYDDNVANQCASGRQALALALTKTEQANCQSYVGTNKHWLSEYCSIDMNKAGLSSWAALLF